MKNTLKQFKELLCFIYGLFKGYPSVLIIKFIISIFLTFIPLLSSVLLKYLIDYLTLGKELSVIVNCVVIFVMIELCIYLMGTLLNYLDNRLTLGMKNKFMQSLLDAIIQLPYSEVEKTETRNFISLAFFGENNIITVFDQVIGVFVSFIKFSTLCVLISTIHPLLILTITICCLCKILINYFLKKLLSSLRKKSILDMRISRSISKLFLDIEYGKEVRLLNIGNFLIEKYTQAKNKVNKNANKVTLARTSLEFAGNLVDNIQTLIAYLVIAREVVLRQITIGDFSLRLTYVINFYSSMSKLSGGLSKIFENIDILTEYRKCIEWEGELDKLENKKLLTPLDFDIEFSHVYFKYPGTDKEILSDVTFKIERGSRVSLVGVNGAGKSTIIKLLCNLYQPDKGNILINGIPLQKINSYDYFKYIGVVFQDFKIYPFSFKENISTNALEDDILEIIREIGLEHVVSDLPNGLNTYMSKQFSSNGIELSGGQKQKLILARALAKRPRILVLDEPTSALDPIAEYALYQDFEKLTQGYTTLFVSHRLASSKFVDKIFVLNEGRIFEEGTHDELMAQNGIYSEMFQLQAQYYK